MQNPGFFFPASNTNALHLKENLPAGSIFSVIMPLTKYTKGITSYLPSFLRFYIEIWVSKKKLHSFGAMFTDALSLSHSSHSPCIFPLQNICLLYCNSVVNHKQKRLILLLLPNMLEP